MARELAGEDRAAADGGDPRSPPTAIPGKWHLGHRPPFLPTRHGFDT